MWRQPKLYMISQYLVEGANPAKNYPPANVAAWIKNCESVGRPDLGKQIMDQWNKVINKYPQTRVNWGAAVKISSASIKKNVFGRQEFSQWLAEQTEGELTAEQKTAAKSIPEPKLPKGIQTPKDDETPEDWKREADKTKVLLDDARSGFESARSYIDDYLLPEIESLKRKIAEYGPGGKKHLTKKGELSKMAERVPKWTAQLEVYEAKVEELENNVINAENKFKAADKAYKNAPVTTVAYEKEAQKALEAMMKVIMNMDDLEEQQKMLAKFGEMIEKQAKKAAASTFSYYVEAGLIDMFDKFFGGIKKAIGKIGKWFKKLFTTVDQFDYVATKLGR